MPGTVHACVRCALSPVVAGDCHGAVIPADDGMGAASSPGFCALNGSPDRPRGDRGTCDRGLCSPNVGTAIDPGSTGRLDICLRTRVRRLALMVFTWRNAGCRGLDWERTDSGGRTDRRLCPTYSTDGRRVNRACVNGVLGSIIREWAVGARRI